MVQIEAASPLSTQDSLLDAAEELFAEHGISKASLRAITKSAGANLAAVHYHFGSKEELVRAVLERRLGPLNCERLSRLDQVEARDPNDTHGIVRAFVEPALQLIQQTRGGHDFARFVGRCFCEPGDRLHALLLEQFRQVIDRFVAAISQAHPELPEEEVYWRFHFMIGSMLYTAGHGYLVHLYSDGRCDPLDVEGVTDRLVHFLTAGMRSPVKPGRERP